MQSLETYVRENESRYIRELSEFLKIPSVSADPRHKPDIERAAKWCADRLTAIGFEQVAIHPTSGNPVITAQWLHAGANVPTVMIYGHYDVQPPDPLEKWLTPPFEPSIRDGKIFARGADDNKGQLVTHLFALEAYLKQTGKLPLNVRVFIEGEEEVGGHGTFGFVEKNGKLLTCDVVAISDSSWHAPDTPSIAYGLRGLCYLQVDIKGPSRDLHSGIYGGMVQNPLNALATVVAKLKNNDGVVLVPGFYDDVLDVPKNERAVLNAIGQPDESLKRDLELKELFGEKGFTSIERNAIRPTLDVNGIWGGYAGAGAKTVIASEGGCKISCRLVPHQDPKKILQLVKKYIEDNAPQGVTVTVTPMEAATPLLIPCESPYLQAAIAAVERGYGKRPILKRDGATIPITAKFLSQLHAPSLLVGHGLNSDAIHSPNENFPLEHLYKGILTNIYLYEELSKVSLRGTHGIHQ